MGKFVIITRKDGQIQFSLKAGNGQEILGSEAYTTKAACMKGVNSVRKNSLEDSRFERLTSGTGKPYFKLKAANGRVIGTSELYESEASCEDGIASVKKNGPQGKLVDETGA